MLLQLQCHTFTLTYKPGKEITLADILSGAYLENEQTLKRFNKDLACTVVCSIVFFYAIKLQKIYARLINARFTARHEATLWMPSE